MDEYALAVSEVELARYRLMAEAAKAQEVAAWQQIGIAPGAVVGDVGCGPAALAAVMAEVVGPDGRVIAVERDEAALALAGRVISDAGVTNVDLRQGDAGNTGIEPGSLDVAVMRHVLAHNGGREQEFVNHLASLVRPGGWVYLVDVDLTAIRLLDADPDLDDLDGRYVEFHRKRGNDPQVGLQLGKLARAAGLTAVEHRGWYTILEVPPGLRPPPWAARESMLADGLIDDGDVQRWEAAFERSDAATMRPTLFAPVFTAAGQR